MTTHEVRKRVSLIARMVTFGKAAIRKAQQEEQRLYMDVLESIATGRCKSPRVCAREARRARMVVMEYEVER